MDAILVIDLISILAASVCAGFIAYGCWLCAIEKMESVPPAEELQGGVARKPLLP